MTPTKKLFRDEQLITQPLAGDHAAFEALVHSHDAGLRGYIRRVLGLGRDGDDEQAQDVLQFVLLQLYLSLPTLSTRHSLKPWLFRVAHNRCMDELRVRRRQRVSHFSELEGGEHMAFLARCIADGKSHSRSFSRLFSRCTSTMRRAGKAKEHISFVPRRNRRK